MTEIVLEEKFDKKGKYLGKIIVDVDSLTPEFLGKIKKDKSDKMGWKKYRKIMKDKGYDIERD
ncbi:hypothetical protein ES703_124241 [subsurface metagenome]